MRTVIKNSDLEIDRKILEENSVDWTEFTDGVKLLQGLGDYAGNWADACSQFTKKKVDIDIKPEYLIPWFANCIEHIKNLQKTKDLPKT